MDKVAVLGVIHANKTKLCPKTSLVIIQSTNETKIATLEKSVEGRLMVQRVIPPVFHRGGLRSGNS